MSAKIRNQQIDIITSSAESRISPGNCQIPGGAPRPTRPLPGAALPRILVSRSAVGGCQGERERENETTICLWDALSRSQQCAYSGGDRGRVASRLRHRHLLRARLGRSRRFPGDRPRRSRPTGQRLSVPVRSAGGALADAGRL